MGSAAAKPRDMGLKNRRAAAANGDGPVSFGDAKCKKRFAFHLPGYSRLSWHKKVEVVFGAEPRMQLVCASRIFSPLASSVEEGVSQEG